LRDSAIGWHREAVETAPTRRYSFESISGLYSAHAETDRHDQRYVLRSFRRAVTTMRRSEKTQIGGRDNRLVFLAVRSTRRAAGPGSSRLFVDELMSDSRKRQYESALIVSDPARVESAW
jgi:hypothetical protein